MKILVIDTETTGLGDDAAVLEFTFTELTSFGDERSSAPFEYVQHEPRDDRDFAFCIGATTSSIVATDQPIEFEAMATHHITPADLVGCASWDDTKAMLIPPSALDRVEAFAAHNADYDKRFFPELRDSTGRDVPWICTYRCAYELIPDAPSHKNGVLRYFLRLPVDPPRTQPAHRAGPDTYVTAHILAHLLGLASMAELVEISNRPRKLRNLGFGKNADVPLAELPDDYIRWMLRQGLDSFGVDVAYTIRGEMERRNEAWRERQRARAEASRLADAAEPTPPT